MTSIRSLSRSILSSVFNKARELVQTTEVSERIGSLFSSDTPLPQIDEEALERERLLEVQRALQEETQRELERQQKRFAVYLTLIVILVSISIPICLYYIRRRRKRTRLLTTNEIQNVVHSFNRMIDLSTNFKPLFGSKLTTKDEDGSQQMLQIDRYDSEISTTLNNETVLDLSLKQRKEELESDISVPVIPTEYLPYLSLVKASVAEALRVSLIPSFEYRNNTPMRMIDISLCAFASVCASDKMALLGRFSFSKSRIRRILANIAVGRYKEFVNISSIPHTFESEWNSRKKTVCIKAQPVSFVAESDSEDECEESKSESSENENADMKKSESLRQRIVLGKGSVGTAHRVADFSVKDAFLMTAYFVTVGNFSYLRSGAFDGPFRFSQWKTALDSLFFAKLEQKQTRKQRRPVRKQVLSLSLCTTIALFKEKKIVDTLYKQSELEKEFQIAQFNYQAGVNEFFWTKVGICENRKMNERGFRLLFSWFTEDLCEIASKWNTTIINISSEMKSLTTVFEFRLDKVCQILSRFDDYCCTVPLTADLEEKSEIDRLIYFGKILNRLLLSHLNTKSVHQSSELLFFSALATLLSKKTAFAVNCKSGCDRSAIVSSLVNAVIMAREVNGNLIYDAILDHENLKLEQGYQLMKDQKHQVFEEFKACYFFNLVQISFPIVVLSTGVPGFKIGSKNSILANPNVCSFLPPKVTLIRYDESDNKENPEKLLQERTLNTSDVIWDYMTGIAEYRGGGVQKQ